ncbi:APC family permease [Athalassotoga sp.]
MFYAIPSAGIVFSYLGFRQALEFGGEAKNPQRDVPRATVYSVLAAIALYTLLQVAFLGAIKWPAGTTWSTLTSSSLGSAPFFTELQYSGIALFIAFSYFLLIDAWISPSGTGWIYSGNSARVLYGIAADGYFPSALLKIHSKTRIPYIALIASLVLGVVFFLPFPSWYLFVGFISSATVLTYVMGPLALMTFRKHAPQLHRPFHLPYASVIAPIAFVGGALIVYWSGITTFTMIFYTTFIGIPIFYFLYASKKLNLSKLFAYTMGLIELVIAIVALVANYMYVLYPSSKESMGTRTEIFLSSLTVMAGIVLLFTAITSLKVSQKDKQMFLSSYWLLSLMIVTELFSYFGAFGNEVLIPFPWDTIVMIAVYSVIYVFALRGGHNTEDLSVIVEEQKDFNLNK